MKFIIQNNLINQDQLQIIYSAVEKYPHAYVGIIPFTDDIMSDEPLDGVDFIPYGSTRLTNMAMERGWSGVHINMDTFNYQAALDNRNDMLNHNVITISEAIDILKASDQHEQFFTRPSHDLKQFSGQVVTAGECLGWFSSMLEGDSSVSYSIKPDTEVVLCSPQTIHAEYRAFIVGGRVVSVGRYRQNGHLSIKNEDCLIDDTQHLANGWLPDPCCVLDFSVVGKDDLKVIEFNSINCAGFYDHNIDNIFRAWWEYHSEKC